MNLNFGHLFESTVLATVCSCCIIEDDDGDIILSSDAERLVECIKSTPADRLPMMAITPAEPTHYGWRIMEPVFRRQKGVPASESWWRSIGKSFERISCADTDHNVLTYWLVHNGMRANDALNKCDEISDDGDLDEYVLGGYEDKDDLLATIEEQGQTLDEFEIVELFNEFFGVHLKRARALL
jgi:hypothetical protein